MNIFLNIKAEDAHRLRQFLKKNPSTKGSGVSREHLDAGIISRVLLDCLVDDEQFIKTFKEKFIHLHLDFEGF